MSRLQTYLQETVVPQLMEQLKLSNVMEVPKITKVTLNMGVGEAVLDKKVMDRATGDMTIDRRSEADRQAVAQVGGFFQDTRWLAGGLQSHTAA